MPRDARSLARHYPPNPTYGNGVFRRRIRMVVAEGAIHGAVNDPYHAMWVSLRLDGDIIAGVTAKMARNPKTLCPGAVRALDELVGLEVRTASTSIFAEGRAGRNCTHLLDIARFALSCHRRGESNRMLDLTIPDPDPGRRTLIRAEADGRIVHSWQLVDGIVTGLPGYQGSMQDANFGLAMRACFDGIALDAAMALRMAVFVAAGRAFVTDGPKPVRALDETERHGDCYAFSAPALAASVDNVGYVQDFTAGLTECLPSVFATVTGAVQ